MEFRVLGPLDVRSGDGAAIPLTGPKRRALLALLVLNAGADIPSARLADELWNGAPPKSVSTTLQTFVYQLRRRYGVEELLTTPSGYRFDAAPDQIDASRFERAVSDACATAVDAPAASARALRDALNLWRGPAYADFESEPWAIAEATRLEQLRLEAVEAWAATSIGAGETAGVAAELEAWTVRNPLREPLWTLRVVALVADGRSAEALRVGTELRAVLAEELGIDPSPQFAAVETAVLRGEPLPAWTELAGLLPRRRDGGPSVGGRSGAVEPAERSRPSRDRRKRPLGPNRHVAGASDVPDVPDDRFVGRGPELEALEAAVESAGNGMPRVVVVVGEPGIGKSRLLDEFTPHAIARGVQVLFGACQEDVGIPYLPVASAFASLGADGNPFAVEQIGAIGGSDDDGAQLGLFLRATRALLASATDRVVMLVIDDLHWADDATLALLRHMVAVGSEDAARDRARLVIVLTTHPPEPGTAIENFVGRLRRSPRTRVIAVRALAAAEVRELAATWLGERPPPPTVDLLLEATGGNPLVLQSTLARVREQGGAVAGTGSLDLLGPTSLDHELWLRVERVGHDCMEMLVNAALLGNGASLDWLGVVSGVDGAAFDDLIDEAATHRVLVADDEHYWFEHPQLRQLLYYSTAADERAAAHLRIADGLAARATDTVIAHHLMRAGTLVAPARLLAACEEAADRSAAVGAWRDAATYAFAALEAGSALDLGDEALAALELRAGRAAFLARDRDLAITHLTLAAQLARSCSALNIWGRAVVRLAREAVEDPELNQSATRSIAALDDFITAAGDEERALRAEAYALQAELSAGRDDLRVARRQLAVAEELVALVDDDEVRTKVKFARGVQHMMSVELGPAQDCFEVALPLAARLADPNPRIWCLIRLGLLAHVTGELARAETLLAEGLAAAHDADNGAEYSMARAVSAASAAVQGRFARVEDEGERARRAYVAAEYWFTPAIVFPTLAAARAHRGDADGAHAALAEWDAVQDRRSRRYRPLIEVLLGDVDGARKMIETAPFRFFTAVPAPQLFLSDAIAAQAELGARIGAPALLDGPLETLIDLYERGMRFTLGWPALVPRVVGLGLNAVGRHDEADAWFERALADARAAPADAEVARTALDHGRVLLARGARAQAEPLLALARERYAAMSIRPPLAEPEQPSRPAAPTPAAAASATRVVLVTDLVGSTALNAELGDRDYLALLREHDEIIRRALVPHDGVEFKHTGDGIGAWFYSVSRALECAVTLSDRFATAWGGSVHTAPGVKIAMSAGEPALVDGDLLGLSVTIAFRLLDYAHPGEVLMTSDVAGLARGLSWAFVDRGREILKGLDTPIELVSVASRASRG